MSSTVSDLEAFSHKPKSGSVAPLSVQARARTKYFRAPDELPTAGGHADTVAPPGCLISSSSDLIVCRC